MPLGWVLEAVGVIVVVIFGWIVEVLVGNPGFVVPLGTGETVSEVLVLSGGVPVSVMGGEAKGV